MVEPAVNSRSRALKSIGLLVLLAVIPLLLVHAVTQWRGALFAQEGFAQAEAIVSDWRLVAPVCDAEELPQLVKERPLWRASAWGGAIALACQGNNRVVSLEVWRPICAQLAKEINERGFTFTIAGRLAEGPSDWRNCTGAVAIIFPDLDYPSAAIARAEAVLKGWRALSPICDPSSIAEHVKRRETWRTSSWGGSVTLACVGSARAISFEVWPPICEDLAKLASSRGLRFTLNGVWSDELPSYENCAGSLALVYSDEARAE